MWIPSGATLIRGQHLFENWRLLEEIWYATFWYRNARVTTLWPHDHIHSRISVTWSNFVNFQENHKSCIKMNFLLFPNTTEIADFCWKRLISAELKGCLTWILCWILVNQGKTVPRFIIVGYVKRIFGVVSMQIYASSPKNIHPVH